MLDGRVHKKGGHASSSSSSFSLLLVDTAALKVRRVKIEMIFFIIFLLAGDYWEALLFVFTHNLGTRVLEIQGPAEREHV